MTEKKFEDALARLEEIVRTMEAGDLSLEDSLKVFEEGIGLVRFCSKKLDEAERRVEILLKENETLIRQPFEEEMSDVDE